MAVIFASDTTNTPYFIPEFKTQYVINILFDDKQTLLVGTRNGYYTFSIRKSEKGNMDYSIMQPINELKGTFVNQIYKDHQSNIWISTANSGVFKTKNNQIIENISIANGLPAADILGTFQDREGNYWFGTTDGVSKFISFENYSFSYENKPVPGYRIVASDKRNRLWLWDGANLYCAIRNKNQ